MNRIIDKEIENLFLWIPVALAIGIIAFFKLPFDPPTYIAYILTFTSFLLAIKLHGHYYHRIIGYGALFISLGFLTATIKTELLDSYTLEKEIGPIWIEAEVSEITHNERGNRLLLESIYSDYLPKPKTPEKIRINLKTDVSHLEIGDYILVKCKLMPPPEPAIPGGFDFREYAYFKQIGAIGYAVGKARLLNRPEQSDGVVNFINKVRASIASRIDLNMEQPSASIATGLLVGDSSSINRDDYEVIRRSGIAHIIAISGMHIVVVVGLIFLSTRFLLSQFPNIILRYNIKKVSAVIAIIGSFIYLLIAGYPVSAQRAFIMSSLVLIAIILDRNASPMRSLAISAIIILLVTPETIMSASLQMSYAACVALIASFEVSKKLFTSLVRYKESLMKKVFVYFCSLTFSSLVAGIATAPFVIYHFNQFSTYSLLTNMVCVPLADFFIMPSGMVALILMPFGLENVGLIPMEYGISFMFYYAKIISDLPNSYFYVPSFTNTGIGLIAIGGLILSFFVSRIRLVGVVPICLGLLTIYSHQKPDIILDKDGKIFAVQNSGSDLVVSSKAKSRFTRDVWMQSNGQNNIETLKSTSVEFCSKEICYYEKNGKTALILSETEKPEIFCDRLDFFINLTNKDFTCQKSSFNITLRDLKKHGAHVLRLDNNNPIETVSDSKVHRFWNGSRRNG